MKVVGHMIGTGPSNRRLWWRDDRALGGPRADRSLVVRLRSGSVRRTEFAGHEDVHFTVRTDTGKTDFEEFVNADVHGKADVMHWQREHRLDSPSPLRHNGTNVHLAGTRGENALFQSYIFVTQIVEGQVSNLSTAS
jgi:hypothetical protein